MLLNFRLMVVKALFFSSAVASACINGRGAASWSCGWSMLPSPSATLAPSSPISFPSRLMVVTAPFFSSAVASALAPSSPISLCSRLMVVTALFFSSAVASARQRDAMPISAGTSPNPYVKWSSVRVLFPANAFPNASASFSLHVKPCILRTFKHV